MQFSIWIYIVIVIKVAAHLHQLLQYFEMPGEHKTKLQTHFVDFLQLSHHVAPPVAEAVIECPQRHAHAGWCLGHMNGQKQNQACRNGIKHKTLSSQDTLHAYVVGLSYHQCQIRCLLFTEGRVTLISNYVGNGRPYR